MITSKHETAGERIKNIQNNFIYSILYVNLMLYLSLFDFRFQLFDTGTVFSTLEQPGLKPVTEDAVHCNYFTSHYHYCTTLTIK